MDIIKFETRAKAWSRASAIPIVDPNRQKEVEFPHGSHGWPDGVRFEDAERTRRIAGLSIEITRWAWENMLYGGSVVWQIKCRNESPSQSQT